MKTKTSLIANRLAIGTFFLHLLITSSLLAQVPAYVPTNGLVGYWPFNGNANDESGNGNNGTVNGATLTADRNGNMSNAFDFNGIDSRISLGNIMNDLGNPNSEASFNVWFKTNSGFTIGSSLGTLICDYKRDGPCCEDGFLANLIIANNPTRISYGCGEGSNDYISESVSDNYLNNQWQFISVTRNGTGIQKLFINGILVDEDFYNPNFNYTNQNYPFEPDWQFGAQRWNNGSYASDYVHFFFGQMDDIAIYNRALTQEEITALYNGTTAISGCTNSTACNYNASATQDDGSCTFPNQTYLNCAGTCINDTDGDGICNELEVPTTPAYLPTNGLVGYWPFNGNANDESGNGNHGTVNGATLTADRNGNANSAYSFDGVANHVNIPFNNLWRGNEVSISAWIKKGESFNNQRIVIGQSNGRPQLVCNSDFTPGFDNAAFQFKNNSNGFTHAAGNLNILNGDWVNLIGVYSSSNIWIYVNGVLDNMISHDDIFDNCNQTPMQVGAFNTSGGCGDGFGISQAFLGLIDDIAIFNRALTQEEITALYNGTTNNGGGGNGGTAGTPAQSVPQGIPYQAMIRDNNGAALVNTPVTVRFSLHQDTIDGAVEYQETHNLTTNAYGLVNTHFGSGTATQGTFANINWSNTTKFIQVEANSGAGFVEMGTQQMMSVPFALQANKATAIKNAGLPVYSDNAAALAGGLVAGEMYRTAAGALYIVY